MDRFDTMRLFCRIVELGSFSRAAADLHLPAATATHAIRALETRLGVRLLQRTTRHVSPTPDGDAYYQRSVRILADVEETEAGLGHGGAPPRGKLRVDLQGTLARTFVLPRLDAFLDRYPDVTLEISLGDRLADLVREGIDCVLRVGELADSAMVGRRVATLRQVTCAAPAYVARHGVPHSLDDLPRHRAVNFLAPDGKPFSFDYVVDGAVRHVTLPGVVAVTDADAYVACAERGLGLVQLPRYHVARQLAQGTLLEVLPQWQAPALPVSVLHPHARQLSPRVRVFVDWLADVMAAAA
jgi:LysR family transcriptional regulator, regulator for bpeEF and oprC